MDEQIPHMTLSNPKHQVSLPQFQRPSSCASNDSMAAHPPSPRLPSLPPPSSTSSPTASPADDASPLENPAPSSRAHSGQSKTIPAQSRSPQTISSGASRPQPASPAQTTFEKAISEKAISEKAISEKAIAPSARQRAKGQWRRSALWTFAGAVALALFSGMGFMAYRWLTWLPPAPDCESLPMLAPDADRLYCAQQAANDGTLEAVVAGIELIEGWRPGHPLYRKAQTSMNEWSAALLRHANVALQEQGIDPAVEIASTIPQGSPLYEEAQDRIAQWQQQWDSGESLYQAALTAIEQQDWAEAREQVAALGELSQSYWREHRADALSMKILDEQTARERLNEAIALAESDDPDQLVNALALITDIQPQTLAWEDAQPLYGQWGQALVRRGLDAANVGDLNRAIALVKHVPIDLAGEGEGKHLLLYSYARRLTDFNSVPWQVNPFETWQLTEAIAAAHQISPDSQFYPLAQTDLARWQQELDNLGQLQLAQWIAQAGNRPALDLAMRQAALVEPDAPRRLQAQTLIAHWNQKMLYIEHRPQLALAQHMAEPGNLEALKAAIAHVSTLADQHTHWPEADRWLEQWTQQAQALEDRPVLVAARQKAAEGNWREAIAQAETIGAERSLYAIAQDSIEEWQTELQFQIDEENLAHARSLASRMRLTQAIHHASQIQPGRPLYDEAQGLIRGWVAERERYRARQYARNQPQRTSQPNDSQANRYDGYYDSRYYNDSRR